MLTEKREATIQNPHEKGTVAVDLQDADLWGFRGGDVEVCVLLVAGIQHQGAGAHCGSAQCYLIIKLL